MGNILDKVRSTESKKVEKTLNERDASSSYLHQIVAALRKCMEGREKKRGKAFDMLIKLRRVYWHARPRVVSLRSVKLLERREKIKILTDEVVTKHLELPSIPSFVVETAMLSKETIRLLEIAKKGDADVAVQGGP